MKARKHSIIRLKGRIIQEFWNKICWTATKNVRSSKENRTKSPRNQVSPRCCGVQSVICLPRQG